ncbi:MAG: GTPase [Candidatus Omnitrophota bacterium]
MIDNVHIVVQAGNGGNGCESYYHRNDKKVVPNGGDGGDGGRVIFRAVKAAPPLSHLKQTGHWIASSGGHGGSNRKRGRNAEDLVIEVPAGTTLTDHRRKLVVRSMMEIGDEVVVVEGGRGGSGNFGGKKATLGGKGEEMDLEVSVRMHYDIAMIGLPNSGKSSLLNHLTRAHVKTESYPFTTKEPEFGVCFLSEYEQIKLCDFPSLYRASHEGRGCGNDFLKHLEFAKCLLYVVDPISEFSESIYDALKIIKSELVLYNEDYAKKPFAIVVTKMDLENQKSSFYKQKLAEEGPIFLVSSVTGEGVEALKEYFRQFMEP